MNSELNDDRLFNQSADPYFVYMGDPYILNYNGNYYLYGTTSNDGFLVYKSDDLLRWGDAAGINNGFALSKEDVWGSMWFWAPEVYYLDGSFFMFFSVEEHIAVAVSQSPLGPFTQETEETLFTGKAIDPHLFIDPVSGTPYLFYVRFNNGNEIWVAEMNSDYLSVKSDPAPHKCFSVSQNWEQSETPPVANVNEGPFVLYNSANGLYYLTYSGNHYASWDYGVGYATSSDPFAPEGGWSKFPGNPILQKPGDLVGTGHHSIFEDDNGKMMIVYHAHNSRLFINPRRLFINRISFDSSTGELKTGNIVAYGLSH